MIVVRLMQMTAIVGYDVARKRLQNYNRLMLKYVLSRFTTGLGKIRRWSMLFWIVVESPHGSDQY